MKKILLFCTASLFIQSQAFSIDKEPVQKWAIKSPFEQKVFIENLGQYTIKERSLKASDIVFGTRQDGLKYFFAKDGLWIMNHRAVERTEKEIEAELERCHVKEDKKVEKGEKHWKWKFVPEFHQMQFLNSNPSVQIIGVNEVSAVHNFYVNKTALVAHAWKKIVYKNLYAGVDMEIYFPEDKTGFKYNFILQPGVDPAIIQIKYPENTGIQLTTDGNILINSLFGDFTDHAPIANEAQNAKAVDCSFTLKKGVVGFKVENYDASKGLIIDPFTATPSFSFSNNAYDVDWDNGGNCYVYGGTSPFQVLKYSAAGALLWTYTTVFTSNWYYGDFAVDRNAGACYITDGFNGGNGAEVIKINTTGAQVAMYNGNSLFQEMWRIAFSKCTNQAVIAGGGTSNPSYTGCYLDTNLINMAPVNVINSPTGLHDMWGIALDAFGAAYFATAQTQVGSAGYDNIIYKVPTPALTPIQWQTPEGYQFIEVASVNYAPGPPNGFNGMTVSNASLYTYDSYVLKKWNIANGALITSLNVNGASQSTMTYGGLTSDDCDNLFLGVNNTIRQYSSALAQVATINAPGNVYDCELGKNNILYSCGMGFVMTSQVNLQPCSILQVTDAITNAGCATNGSATVTVTGGTSPYTITWNTTPPQTGPVLSNVPGGTYIATITDNSCIKQTTYDTVVIATGGGGTPMTVNSGSVCPGGSIVLTATGATSYTWSPGTGLSGISGPTVTATPSVTTTYTVSGTQTGCTGSITSTVTIHPLPTVTANSGTICLGQQTATLTAAGASTYAWSPGTGLSATTGTSVNATPGATTIYTITGTDVNGCVNTGTTTVNVNPLPNVTSSSSTVCPTGTGSLTAAGATSYTWNTGVTTASISAAPASTTVYTVTGTDVNGCISAGTGTITVNNVLVVTAGSNSPVCQGAVLTLSTTIGVSWSWTGPNGFSSTSQNPNIPNVAMAAGGTYSLTATDAFGCFGSVTVPVTINPSPTPIAGSNSPVCVNQNLNLTASGGVGYLWNGPNTFTSTLQNPTLNGVTTSANGIYTVTVVDANSCVGTTTVNIIINPLPVITATGATVCTNGTINLSCTPSGATAYSWGGPLAFTSNSQNPSIPLASSGMTGNYAVTVTDVNGCVNANVAQVVVNDLPIVSVTTTTICLGQTTGTLSASGANTYAWSPVTGLSSSTGAIVTANPGANTNYTVTGTDMNGCVNTATTVVTVNPIPVVAVGPQTSSGCAPVCVNLLNTTTASGNCSWDFGDGSTSTGCTPVHCFTTQGTYNPVLTLTDANGCVGTSTATVIVYPVPDADFNATPQPTSILNPTIYFYDASSGAIISGWSWNFGDPNNDSSTVQNPNFVYPAVGSYQVMLTVVSNQGCVDSTIKIIKIDDELMFYIPNAFSPNGDGVNEGFKGTGMGIDTTTYQLWIFDRWGSMIFYTADMEEAWDGRIQGKGGEIVQEDVYVWTVKFRDFRGKKHEHKGTVSVLK